MKEALDFLYRLRGKKYNLDLKAISRLMGKLGNPHKGLKVIHVAGTNGKGSTCAIIASMIRQAGKKTGMYTSPHLIRINERIKIDGEDIPDRDFTEYYRKVRKHYKDETFFEFMTAMAFLYFFEKKVDYAVIEVGLGGRLDATNIITPLISIITNIGLEHERYLGYDTKKIAYEKAGIIKEGVPVVTGAAGEALDAIRSIAAGKGSRLHLVEKDGKDLRINLHGAFQKHNALIALKAAEIAGIDEKAAKAGLLKVEWPGRFEFISENILVDCAHNLDAVKVLKKELERIRGRYSRVVVVIGILDDKNYKAMLKELETVADMFILTEPKIERATKVEVLLKAVNKEKRAIKGVRQAVSYAEEIAGKDDLILITGSIYTVGEAMGRT